MGGAAVSEEMEVQHDGKLCRAFSAIVFETETQRWVMHYVNERSGRFVPMEGMIDGDGSVWRSIAEDRSREAKLVYARSGPSEWRGTQFATDDGANWFTIFTDDLQRTQSGSN